MVPERLLPLIEETRPLAERFGAAGRTLYLVGGVVRDAIVGRLAPDVDLEESRTIATMVLLGVGLSLLVRLARPLTRGRRAMIAALGAAYVLALVVPPASEFFLLNVPPPIVVLAALGSASIAMWLFDWVDSTQDVWLRWIEGLGSRFRRRTTEEAM